MKIKPSFHPILNCHFYLHYSWVTLVNFGFLSWFFYIFKLMVQAIWKAYSMFNMVSRYLTIFPDFRNRCSYKRETPGVLVVMELFLYLDSITINNLAVILYYSVASCHHCEKLGKCTWDLCIVSYNWMWIYKKINSILKLLKSNLMRIYFSGPITCMFTWKISPSKNWSVSEKWKTVHLLKSKS